VKHSNGLIYWCGRIDSQVKIRGMRVVLEHVENNIHTALRQLPQYTGTVRDVKVVYDTGQYGPDTAQLICILQVLSSSHEATVNTAYYHAVADAMPLLELLATVLTPAEMPTVIVQSYSEFPMTSSGKLDRHALLTTCKQSQQQQQQQVQQQPQATTDSSTNSKIDDVQTMPQQYMTQHQQISRALIAVFSTCIPNCKHLVQDWLNTSNSSSSSSSDSNQSDMLTCAQLGITSMQAVEIAHKLRNEHNLAIDATDLLQYDLTLAQLVHKIAARDNIIRSDTSTNATSAQDFKRAHDDTSANNTAVAIIKKHKADAGSDSSSTTSNVSYNMSVGRCGRGHVSTNDDAGSSNTTSIHSVHTHANSSDKTHTLVVKMQQQWSVPCSKCVDATPLVLTQVPKDTTDTTTAERRSGVVVIASHR
jgi:acyl carrier protein